MDIGGAKIITGGNRLATGVVDIGRTEAIVADLVRKGFGSRKGIEVIVELRMRSTRMVAK